MEDVEADSPSTSRRAEALVVESSRPGEAPSLQDGFKKWKKSQRKAAKVRTPSRSECETLAQFDLPPPRHDAYEFDRHRNMRRVGQNLHRMGLQTLAKRQPCETSSCSSSRATLVGAVAM